MDWKKYLYDADPELDEARRDILLRDWTPRYGGDAVPLKEAGSKIYRSIGRQFVADRVKRPYWRAFRQPYIGLDVFLLQDIYLNTPAGRVVDYLVQLTTGTGWKPVLKPVSEEEMDEAKAEQIRRYDESMGITAALRRVDASVIDGSGHAYTLRDHVEGLMKNALVFGRGMVVRKKAGETYSLYPIHPRDMVWNIVDEDWRLRSVQTALAPEPYNVDDTLYLEWSPASPVYNVMYYGTSFMQRMIDSARALRRIKGTDMQLIARKKWSTANIVAMTRHEGGTDAQTIANNLEGGRVTVTEEDDPQNAYAVHQIPVEKGTEKVVDMAEWLTKDIITMGGIPTTLFYDESAANHAVFDVRIRAFAKQIEEEFRPWAAQILNRWYNKNLADHFPGEIGKYKIEVEFEPVDFSSMKEKAEAVKALGEIAPLTTEYMGQVLHVDDFASKVDTDEIERRRGREEERIELEKKKAEPGNQGNQGNRGTKEAGLSRWFRR